MSVKSKYSVESIQKHETYDWLLFKHYAKRLTNIKYSFGLFDEKKYLSGICTFGIPAVSQWADNYLELNRLCVNVLVFLIQIKIIMDISIKLQIGYIQD